jgi:mono/diheme cytochrome c family protein
MTQESPRSTAAGRLTVAALVVALGMAWAAPSPAMATEDPIVAPSFELTDPERIALGKKRFNKTCAGYCHGSDGVGGRAPDFKGRTDLADEEAYRTIFHGRRTSDIMPPWGAALSPDQIWELVAYIKFLGTQ